MAQFILVGSEGRFPIPDGESRVGSDSSCAVCVHGEGVLPVHAYLKVDGDKLLIRPFNEKAAIMVESGPVTGPQVVRPGERVSLGPVRVRLVAERARWRFPWRLCGYLLGGLVSVLLVLVLLRYLWFNEGWWKAQILTSVEKALGRENAAIGKLDLYLLDGRILVHDLTVANREPFPEDSSLLEVPEMELSINVWQFLRSRFSEIRGGHVTLKNPLLKIERIEREGRTLSNVDDLFANLRRYTSEGLRTLAALDGAVDVEGGRVEFRDRFAGAESVLSEVSLRIAQEGFDRKLAVRLEAHPETGIAAERPPWIRLGGEFRLFDETGRIDPGTVGDGKFALKLESFDLARLCQHLRWEWRVRNGDQKIVPGKPVTGELTVSFSNLDRCEVTGSVESESLVSLLEPDRPPLGNIPTVVAIDRLTFDFAKGWPTDLEVNLRADRTLAAARSHADAKALVMRASLRRSATGEEIFEVNLRSQLQDLCATDIGERLQLKGRLEGGLKASASFVREPQGDKLDTGRGPQTRIDATVELDRSARVLVPSPLPNWPGRWQPLRLSGGLEAVAGTTLRGELSDLKKGRIKVASDAFSIESTTDTELSSLDRLDQFSLKTKLKLKLRGREFWAQYGPVLDLFGFDRPIEEELELDLTALSTTLPAGPRAGTRQVEIGFKGTAARQWAPDPVPVALRFILDYYPESLAASAQGTAQPLPYLVLLLQAGTQEQQPYAELPDVEVTRNGATEIIRIPALKIQSDMDAFEGRFRPYLKWAGEFLGTDFLDRYRLSGQLGANGELTVTRPVKRFGVGAQPFEAKFRLEAKGENLCPSGPVFTLSEDPDAKPRRWTWTEAAPSMTLEGQYRFRPAPNKEEPDVRVFDALNLKMKGGLGDFSFAGTDLDLFLLEKLATRARVPGKSWPDAAGSMQVSGTVRPAAFDLLRSLELPGLKAWLTDPLVSGSLRLNASYNRREDMAQLKELAYQQEAGVTNAFWMKELDLVARLRNVRKLANDIFGRPRGAPLEPIRLLEHLEKGLVVKKLVFDTPAFAAWLSNHPDAEARENSFADFVPPALASMFRTRILDPQGPWMLSDLGLEAIANQEQAWRVYGRFQNDFLLALPQAFSLFRGSPAPTLAFKGPWTVPEKDAASLTLDPEGQYMHLSLRADLDSTDLAARNLYPAWVYLKDANQPLRLNLVGLFPLMMKGPRIFKFTTLALNGGPVDLTLEECQAQVSAGTDGPVIESFRLDSGTVKGGPLFADARMEGVSYSKADDQLIGRMTARRVEVPVLSRVLPPLPGWSYAGRLGEVSLDARGGWSALRALNPDAVRDHLRAEFRCENLLVTADAGRGETVKMELNGNVGIGPTRVDGKDLQVVLLHSVPGEGTALATPVKHVARLPALLLATQQVGQSLRQAFAKQPYALQLNLPLQFETPMDLDRLNATWQALRRVHYQGQVPRDETEPTNPWECLSALRADGALRTPSLKLGRWTLDGLDIPRYSLRDLKLNVPLCALQYAGGDLVLTTAFYDLTRPEISHSQKFELTKADLGSLLGVGADGYRVNGSLTLEGEIQGLGLTPGASWEGTADLHLRGATIDPPAAFAPAGAVPAGVTFLERLPFLVRAAWKQLAGQRDLATSVLLRQMAGTVDPAGTWDALFTATSLALAGFGNSSHRLEFEPAQLQVIITHGLAELRPARLVGRGGSLGLELSAAGRMRLGDRSIDDALLVYPLQLPPEARKALRLDDWSKAERDAFMDDLSKGRIALRLTGAWPEVRFGFPFVELRERISRAMPPRPKPPNPQGVKPPPLPEEDPSLTPEQVLFAIFDRLAKQP